jgi:hemerythrin-like domain-containing protein
MKLLDELKHEHQIILGFLKLFENMLALDKEGRLKTSDEDFELAFSFISNYVDQLHHGKEEAILFPVAFEAKLLQGGGPKCTQYFGMFIQDRFLEKFKSEISEEDNIPEYKPKTEIQNILKEKDPLSIPLEDHQAGYYALKIMKSDLKKRRGQAGWSCERFCRVAQWYIKMLRQHIGKEDECLFVRLESVLSPDQSNHLSRLHGSMSENTLSEQALKDLSKLQAKY